MVTNIKIMELKKHLKQYNQKELINLISELYKLDNGVKDYVTVKFMGEETIQQLFERAEKEIEDEFFPDRGFGKMRLAKAKKEITNFKKLTNNHLRTIDLMLRYVEMGTEFTNTYGDINETFYNSMESMYYKVVKECEKDESLFHYFKDPLYSIVIESDGIGWGYHDNLKEIYYSISWLEE